MILSSGKEHLTEEEQMTPPTANPNTEHWPLDRFKTDERELSRHDDPEATKLQGQDMLANGQIQPVGVTEDGRMIFGHGRYLAAKSAGMKTLETKVYPSSLTETQFRLIRAAENLHRKELRGYQKSLLCADLMCANPGWQMKDLAEALHLSPSMATRLLSPSKCIQEWQDALKEDKVGISDVYAASKLPQEKQAGLLALKLSGATRDQIEQAGRKSRNGRKTEHVRQARVVCPLSTGARIVVTGPEMDLDGLIEALQSALDAARRANKDSLDVKTFERVQRDKAKAG